MCSSDLTAFWFPGAIPGTGQKILDALERNKVLTQLWVSMPDPGKDGTDAEKAKRVAERLKPLALEAARRGHKLGLYNHGGWAGEPESMLLVREALNLPNVGIVYNLHHAHDALDRFPQALRLMLPHLICFNLNGMTGGGDAKGRGQVEMPAAEADRLAAAINAVEGDPEADDDGEAVAAADAVEIADAALAAAQQRSMSAEEAITALKGKIDRLGPVNMMAIEQFDELETRHTFLTTQRQDLVDSIAQTAEAIKRIDETTILFEETNHDLGLVHRWSLSACEQFGLVRRSELVALGEGPVGIEYLDGFRGLLPPGVGRETYDRLKASGDRPDADLLATLQASAAHAARRRHPQAPASTVRR